MLTDQQKLDVLNKFHNSVPITDDDELDFIVGRLSENVRRLQQRIDDRWLADMRRGVEDEETTWDALAKALSDLYTSEYDSVREEAFNDAARYLEILRTLRG